MAPLLPGVPVVVGLGDSITFNSGSWFRQVCARGRVLRNCVDAGIRGNTTGQMLARLDADVLTRHPALVIVMGGTNDVRHGLPAADILRRLDLIVDRIQVSGTTAVLCTIPPGNEYGPQVRALNRVIRDYAARGHVPLLDLYPAVAAPDGSYRRGLSWDGVHPNENGSARMTRLAERDLPAVLTTELSR